MPDHPVGEQVVHRGQVRVELAHRRAPELPGPLGRHRADEPVRREARTPPRVVDQLHRTNPAAARLVGGQPLPADEPHALAAQVRDPRVDPRLVGRQVEHPVDLPVVALLGHGEDERLPHVADRPRARHGLLGGDQVAGQPGGEDLLVLLGAGLRTDEVPPAAVLPLPEPALVAAGEEDQQPLHEVGQLLRRHVPAGQLLGQVPTHPLDAQQRLRVRADAEDEGVGVVTVADELPLRGVDEVVPDAVGVAGERRTTHRVRHVVVEAREEPEAVLPRQLPSSAGRGAADRDAPGLAAPGGRLEDGHLVAALDQLVRGRQAGHAAAEDGHAPTGRAGERRWRAQLSHQGRGPDDGRGLEQRAPGQPARRRAGLVPRAGACVGHVVISRDVDSSTVTTTLSRSGHAAVQPVSATWIR